MPMITREWLKGRTSVERIEALMQPRDDSHLGYHYLSHDSWERLKGRMRDGDEIWEFGSPPGDDQAGGYDGYALVRNGEPVETIPFARLW